MKHKSGQCYLCGQKTSFKYNVYSNSTNKSFLLYSCSNCGLWQINPIPQENEVNSLYENNYFGQRTDRGYNNYLSDEVRKVITSTFEKNLSDLGFFLWENSSDHGKTALEIGAASGHFVKYLSERNWNITGIDISKEMTDAGKKAGLKMIHGNFLTHPFSENYDLIVLWATLEHLPNPLDYLMKIKKILAKNGHLYLTTANTGFWAKIYGSRWRYLNVPEHIFYFNKKNLAIILDKAGLKINYSFTYGSGFTAKKNAGFLFKVFKKIFDFSAKFFHSGDMIVLDIVHNNRGAV
jgi:2-polyprenyl-3-methyl-5-hydroxy-6-metoxy-1,4-benzoquinol methylase